MILYTRTFELLAKIFLPSFLFADPLFFFHCVHDRCFLIIIKRKSDRKSATLTDDSFTYLPFENDFYLFSHRFITPSFLYIYVSIAWEKKRKKLANHPNEKRSTSDLFFDNFAASFFLFVFLEMILKQFHYVLIRN